MRKIAAPLPQTLDLPPSGTPSGRDVLMALLRLGRGVMEQLHVAAPDNNPARGAWIGTIRGDGPGVSLGSLMDILQRDHPIEPTFPFEGSHLVGGAAWHIEGVAAGVSHDACVKLHWRAGADDLPMHTHGCSDRVIIVLSGRGFFHFSDDPIETFGPESVCTLAVRERDVLTFTRGIVHTFSTAAEPMTLLSIHLPFVPLEHDEQYTLPSATWTARERATSRPSTITAGRWAVLV